MKFRVKRIIALIIDFVTSLLVGLLIIGAVVLSLGLAGFSFNINLSKYSSFIGASAFVIGFVSINIYFLGKYQASLGKKLLGLKVSGVSNVYLLLLRTAIPVAASYLTLILAALSAINYLLGLGPKNKCGHDYLLKTEVVNA